MILQVLHSKGDRQDFDFVKTSLSAKGFDVVYDINGNPGPTIYKSLPFRKTILKSLRLYFFVTRPINFIQLFVPLLVLARHAYGATKKCIERRKRECV
jgi:hypothetical protein